MVSRIQSGGDNNTGKIEIAWKGGMGRLKTYDYWIHYGRTGGHHATLGQVIPGRIKTRSAYLKLHEVICHSLFASLKA